MKKSKNCPGNNHICEYLLTLQGEGDRKFVPGVVRVSGIVEDDFHGATAPGASEIKTLIAVVCPGGNYLPVPMSFSYYLKCFGLHFFITVIEVKEDRH